MLFSVELNVSLTNLAVADLCFPLKGFLFHMLLDS